MSPDSHIEKLIEECQRNPELTERAWVILREFHAAGKAIAICGGNEGEKQRLVHAARERMRTKLCDLVQPLDLDGTDEYPPTSSPPGPTQQTKPGG